MIRMNAFFQYSKYPGCYTRGTQRKDNRDSGSAAGNDDTTIILKPSTPVLHISGIFVAGVYSRDRKSTANAFCHGFKLDGLNTCSWIPTTVNESKSYFQRLSLDQLIQRTQREVITPL